MTSDNPLVRVLTSAAIQACDHYILDSDHYRENGACLCDDPDAEIMNSWGYSWDEKKGRWV